MRIRVTVAYDGAGFHGWQAQPELRTVQGELRRMLARLGEEGYPTGAGRTDTGVHALGNVAHADLVRDWDGEELANALLSLAPPDLGLSDLRRVGEDFHARFGAVSRRYLYALTRDADPLLAGRRVRVGEMPDPGWAERELATLVGEKDFAGFARTGSNNRTTRCTMVASRWHTRERGALLELTADRFLYGMVRAVAGSLLRGWREAEDGCLGRVLAAGRRDAAGEAAPSEGLYLAEVLYPGESPDIQRTERVARIAGLGGPRNQ